MGSVDIQFTEDVLAMRGEGVDAGESLGSNLLGGLALSDGAYYLYLGSCQEVGLLFFLLLADNGFQCSLADITLMLSRSY